MIWFNDVVGGDDQKSPLIEQCGRYKLWSDIADGAKRQSFFGKWLICW